MIELLQARAGGSGADTAEGQGTQPTTTIVIHVHRFAEPLHHFDTDNVRVEQIQTTARAFGGERQQCRENHCARMCIGRLVKVIVVKRMRRRTIYHCSERWVEFCSLPHYG